MPQIDYARLLSALVDERVDRPNKASAGSLSGHAAGEPFEKRVYNLLKESYPQNVFKQHEFLNDLYLRHPKHITVEQRNALFASPTALFLLSRGAGPTRDWSPAHVFEERQSDTADIVFCEKDHYTLLDVKTRNVDKDAMPPNIISAYKLAKTCAYMIDNADFDAIDICYVEVEWQTEGDKLRCLDAHHADLFKSDPRKLYINWAAAMQIQFHVCDLPQTWKGTRAEWAKAYLKAFVKSARERVKVMREKYITPFLKYIQ